MFYITHLVIYIYNNFNLLPILPGTGRALLSPSVSSTEVPLFLMFPFFSHLFRHLYKVVCVVRYQKIFTFKSNLFCIIPVTNGAMDNIIQQLPYSMFPCFGHRMFWVANTYAGASIHQNLPYILQRLRGLLPSSNNLI